MGARVFGILHLFCDSLVEPLVAYASLCGTVHQIILLYGYLLAHLQKRLPYGLALILVCANYCIHGCCVIAIQEPQFDVDIFDARLCDVESIVLFGGKK